MEPLDLTHYIVVRRDLPLGAVCSQIAHAAGESFYALGTGSSDNRAPGPSTAAPASAGSSGEDWEVGGVSPSRCSSVDPSRTKVVVLAARTEARLLWLERRLLAAGIPHVAIREPDEPYAGQLMAIGVHPGDGEALRRSPLKEFHMLTRLDAPIEAVA